jgi:hypothetical protein
VIRLSRIRFIIMEKNRRTVKKLGLAIAALLTSCGTDDLSPTGASGSAGQTQDALVFSGSIDESPNGSYIVAFRDFESTSLPAFGSFLSEARHFHHRLTTQFLTDRRVNAIDFLHSVNFDAVLGNESFASEFGTPRFLQNSLGARNSQSTIGIVAKVDFESESAAVAALSEWYGQGLVWFAEPDYRSEPTTQGSFDGYIGRYDQIGTCSGGIPAKYWLEEIDFTDALQELSSKRVQPVSPIIAVMDSGVDFSHDHLSARKWVNPAESVGRRGCSNDQNGCNTTTGSKGLLGDGDIGPFDLQADGRCPVEDDGLCSGRCCHGTHVAGIIAGFKDSGDLGMGGVCPMCQILAIRVLGKPPGEEKGTILDSSIIRGLKYVSYFSSGDGFGVRVVNASFGKFQRSRSVALLIRQLRKSFNGVLVIGAAGNEDSMKPNYPAGYNDALAVSNIDRNGGKHRSSNFGRWVDIAAPGGDICSTVPGNSVEKKSGTSMAAPVVAGVAGLLLAANPDLNYDALRDRLVRTADAALYENSVNRNYIPRIPGEPAPIPLLGTGRVNASSAIKAVETQDLPVVGALDRVSVSCGTIGPHASRSILGLLFLAVLPFALSRLRRCRNGH